MKFKEGDRVKIIGVGRYKFRNPDLNESGKGIIKPEGIVHSIISHSPRIYKVTTKKGDCIAIQDSYSRYYYISTIIHVKERNLEGPLSRKALLYRKRRD